MEFNETLAESRQPLINNSVGWTRFMAIILILSGASYCAMIITIPLGIPMIFASLALFKAADYGNIFNKNNDPEAAINSMNSFFKSFRITGIVTLVCLILSVISFIGFILLAIIVGNGDFFNGEISNFIDTIVDSI